MKALDFSHNVRKIAVAMKADELISLMGPWLSLSASYTNPQAPVTDPQKNTFAELVFSAYAGYAALLQSEGTRKILDGLNLKDTFEPNRLRLLVSAISNFQNVAQVAGFGEAHRFFEKLQSLQKLASTCESLLEGEKVGVVGPEQGIVELELADYDQKGIEPERIQRLVVIVRKLHTNFARIHGVEGDQLRFKYFDSGSSVLVGIQAGKAITESISRLVLEWWDKVRFARFDTFDKKMEAISNGLTVIATVKQSVESQVIDEETGRNLTRRVLKEVDQLVGIGATVPLEAEATVDQRGLLTEMRDVKLLSSGDLGTTDDDNDS